MPDMEEQLKSAADKLGIGSYKRHVLLCTGPNCCSPEEGQAAWDALKQQIKQHNLGSEVWIRNVRVRELPAK